MSTGFIAGPLSSLSSPARNLDVICLGRAGMDLYAQEEGVDFSHVTGFTRHVGGSPANIAIGLARLGLRAGFIGRVSGDMVGRYVRLELERHGVNTLGLRMDRSGTRTSLAITEMRPHDCEVVIYRHQAADLALEPDDIDPGYIGSSRVLLVSGTALCVEPSRAATLQAMRLAREQGTAVVLDLDYRAYTWQSEAEAGEICTRAAQMCDLLIGNREEFAVLGADIAGTARSIATSLLSGNTSAVIVKDGDQGCTACLAEGHDIDQAIFAVAARKPFGAGDGFAAALLAALLGGRSWTEALREGAAAAAMVVASRACGEAMPSPEVLEHFLHEQTPVAAAL